MTDTDGPRRDRIVVLHADSADAETNLRVALDVARTHTLNAQPLTDAEVKTVVVELIERAATQVRLVAAFPAP